MMLTKTSTIDSRHYRNVMGHVPTSVVVVAGRELDTGQPAGLVVGTFQSLSLDPPLVSFSVARTSSSWPKIRPSGRFSGSVLASGQDAVCRAMSAKHTDKFAGVDWTESVDGNPHICRAHAWIDCETERELEAGDHIIVVARVFRLTAGDGEPLVFHRGRLGAYWDSRVQL